MKLWKPSSSWVPSVVALSLSLLAGPAAWSQPADGSPPPAPGEDETQEAGEPFSSFLMVRGGWSYVFSADTIVTLNGDIGGIGTTVDFANTLDADRTASSWRIDALLRLNDRHAFGFSYYKVDRSSGEVIDASLEFEDRIFTAGASVRSQLDIDLYRLLYNYSFYHSEKAELGLSIGVYVADIETELVGDLTCTGADVCDPMVPLVAGRSGEELTVPLPSLGAIVNYDIFPRLQAQFRFDWFYIEVGDFNGSMFEFYTGLEYRAFDHFGLGAAFNRLDVGVSNRRGQKDGWEIDNDWNMVFMYGALYF